jgi:hypothetical protein
MLVNAEGCTVISSDSSDEGTGVERGSEVQGKEDDEEVVVVEKEKERMLDSIHEAEANTCLRTLLQHQSRS